MIFVTRFLLIETLYKFRTLEVLIYPIPTHDGYFRLV